MFSKKELKEGGIILYPFLKYGTLEPMKEFEMEFIIECVEGTEIK